MDRRRRTMPNEEVNRNDSDETFYEPDLDKHPDEAEEARCFAADSEAVDAYFEQTYNRYGLHPSLVSRAPRSPRGGTDETFYSPAEQDGLGAPPQPPQLPNTDETFFEPAERGAHLHAHPHPPRAGRRPVPADSLVVPQSPPSHVHADDEDEAFYEEGEYRILEDAVASALGHPEDADVAENSSLFTHDWSQLCWGQWNVPRNHQQQGDAENDVYLQIPDPVTQEVHSYKVPGVRMDDPDSLSMFTQDLGWTQTQPCVVLANHDASGGLALVMTQGTKDLDWTQTQHLVQMASSESQVMDTMCAGDLDGLTCEQQTCAPTGASALASAGTQQASSKDQSSSESQVMDTISAGDLDGLACEQQTCAPTGASALASAGTQQAPSKDQSMETVTCPPQRMQANSSSLVSSEPNVVPSIPSFEDDAYVAPPPCLPLEEQRKMEEIVASFRNISFCLNDAEAVKRDEAIPPVPPPSRTSCSLQLSQGPRSPTFPTNARRRGRRPRPRARTVPSEGQAPSSPVLGSGKASSNVPGKRKRTAANHGQHRRSQSAVPTCSPSSPPRRKARKTTCAARNASKGRAEMIPVYTRLQEMRFLMQGVIRGTEPLPTSEEVSLLSSEVLTIENNLKQALKFDVASKQVKVKQEEALQVADKILHQLRVLAEIQNSEAPQDMTEDNIHETSCSNPATIKLRDSSPVNIETDAKTRNIDKQLPKTEHYLRVDPPNCNKTEQKAVHTFNLQECHQLSHGDKHFIQEEDSQENDPHDDTTGECDPMFAKEDYFHKQVNTTAKISDISATCTSKSPKVTSLQIQNIQGNCSTLKSKENTQLLISIGPDTCCSSSAEKSDLLISKELPIHTDDSQETEFISTVKASSPEKYKEEVSKVQSEYQQIMSLIKMTSEMSRSQAKENRKVTDYVWRGGPLKLTGILLPKSSELAPIDDLPPNFWDDPQAPIPEEWANMLEWDE